MAFKFIVLLSTLAFANAGFLGGATTYAGAPALAYSAAPAVSYAAATPTLGSTFHGNYAPAAPALTYAAAPVAPAYSYAAAPVAPAYSYAAAPTAITSQSSNILRSYGNLGQVSTYSKTIDTPFSSVRKADIRVSNPGLRIATATPVAAVAPAVSTYHGFTAGPAISYGAAPSVAIASPALSYGAPAIGLRAAPALSYGAPAIGLRAAPALSYGAPSLSVGHAVAAPAAIGVAYSAAPAVSHLSYASSYANYGW